MPAKSGKSYQFDELVKLEYDLAVDLYRQRTRALEVEALAKSGKTLEYYIYKTFGFAISSLALTLNPYWQFDRRLKVEFNKLNPGTLLQIPVQANRTRSVQAIWPSSSVGVLRRMSKTVGTHRVWTGSGFTLASDPDASTDETTRVNLGTQAGIVMWKKDTTWKSRNPRAPKIPFDPSKKRSLGLMSQGEFELWKPKFDATFGSISWSTSSLLIHDYQSPVPRTETQRHGSTVIIGPCASLDAPGVVAAAAGERLYAMSTLAKHANGLIAQAMPGRRRYNAFYQLAELRDLPGTIRGSLSAWRDVEAIIGSENFSKALRSVNFWSPAKIKLVQPALARAGVIVSPDKAIADAFLTFQFGWASMYQAVTSIIGKPQKIAKDINTLINQNGKMMTFHSSIGLPSEEWTSFPTIIPYPPVGFLPDPNSPLAQSGKRTSVRLRGIVNFEVQMPPIDVPTLRKRMFDERIGLSPRPSDLYQLIPWTWLIDWFSGLGEYLKVLEEVHSDPKLINYGLLVYESTLESAATRGWFYGTSNTIYQDTAPSLKTEDVRILATTTGSFSATYKLRVDAASMADVKLTAGRGLSTMQQSILGALLSKFS